MMNLLNQYKLLSEIHKQLDACLPMIDDSARLTDQLNNIQDLINKNRGLFSESNKIGFFSKQAPLPHEFNEMIREVNEALKILETQMKKQFVK